MVIALTIDVFFFMTYLLRIINCSVYILSDSVVLDIAEVFVYSAVKGQQCTVLVVYRTSSWLTECSSVKCMLVVGSFMSRMTDYMNSSESNTIFTDDLKSAICLAETDDDVDVIIEMTRRCTHSLIFMFNSAQI